MMRCGASYYLSHAVSKHLREDGLLAGGVQIGIKNTALFTSQSQSKLIYPTQNSREIALKAFSLFKQTYKWQTPVRAVTVRAIELLNPDKPQQLSLGFDMTRHEKLERLDKAMLRINEKYGKGTVTQPLQSLLSLFRKLKPLGFRILKAALLVRNQRENIR